MSLSFSQINSVMFVTGGNVGIETKTPANTLEVNGDIRATNNWLRTTGTTGWYNETYNGGWYMSDTTWLRTQNSKSLWANNGIIATNGRFGVNTSSPSYPLHINATSAYINGTFYMNTGGCGFFWGGSGTNSKIYDNGDMRFYTDDNTHFDVGGYSNVMYVNASGFVGFGTSPSYPIHVTNTVSGSISGYGYLSGGGAGLISGGSGTTNISIVSSGRIICPEFNATSDIRIKKNITDITPNYSIDIINQLKPVQYKYIDVVAGGDRPMIGFIAQDVEKIIPHAIDNHTDFIPDIFDIADINGKTLTLRNSKTDNLQIDTKNITPDPINRKVKPKHKTPHKKQTFTHKTKLKVYFEDTNETKEVTVDKIIDDHSFTIIEDINEHHTEKSDNPHIDDKIKEHLNKEFDHKLVFVYGKKVNDFKTLTAKVLFTHMISNIQALSKKLDLAEEYLNRIQR
jgi:hypothetical protein